MNTVLKLLALVVLILVLAAGLALWRSASMTNPQPAAQPPRLYDVDRAALAQRLAAAVQIPTVSHADWSQVDEDAFRRFRSFLHDTFPEVHNKLNLEVVNEHALLYSWTGTDPDLAPVLLMAHYDVVPVEPDTADDWDYPPFSGHISGHTSGNNVDNNTDSNTDSNTDAYIWGRGTLDNKNAVVGLLEAVEALLRRDLAPERTILLAFGHDEEVGGERGARAIADLLAERYGQLAMVLDEGGFVVADNGLIEGPAAFVGTAEKGYLSLRIVARHPGGHSGQPPAETAVTRLANALVTLQQSPFPARLTAPTSTMFEYLGPELPFAARLLLANRPVTDRLLLGQLAGDHLSNAMIRTTAAPTMLRGSEQDNVLPQRAEAVVNFRLLPGDTAPDVIAAVEALIGAPDIEITPTGNYSDPSPVSRTDGPAWALLSRTIRAHFPEALVTPYLVLGATDARHFAELSDHIYRFLPFRITASQLEGMHGTNERLGVASYTRGVQFYQQLIEDLAACAGCGTLASYSDVDKRYDR